MSFASNMQATALRLLTKYGQAMSVSRVDEGAFVPSTGAVGSGSTTSFSGYGYPDAYTIDEIDNVTILATDIQLYIRVSQEIKVGDVIVFDGVDHRVMDAENINTQAQNIIYRCQIRA